MGTSGGGPGSAGGGGIGGGGGGNLTSEFPQGREPEREQSTSEQFDQSANDDYQQQMEEQLRALEAQRQAPEVQGMDYTIGGSVEQSVHTDTFYDREAEIKELQEKMESFERGRSR